MIEKTCYESGGLTRILLYNWKKKYRHTRINVIFLLLLIICPVLPLFCFGEEVMHATAINRLITKLLFCDRLMRQTNKALRSSSTWKTDLKERKGNSSCCHCIDRSYQPITLRTTRTRKTRQKKMKLKQMKKQTNTNGKKAQQQRETAA